MSAATSSRSSATWSRSALPDARERAARTCRPRRMSARKSACSMRSSASRQPGDPRELPQEAARRRTRRQGNRDRDSSGGRRQMPISTFPACPARRSAQCDQYRRHARQGLRRAPQDAARERQGRHDAADRRGIRQAARSGIVTEAIRAVEKNGIVFLDEIDKICAREGMRGRRQPRRRAARPAAADRGHDRQSTKHGPVKTDHILFIASGAFHVAKPSDLLPELQGRLPIRVELKR
jgi:hypothetical protein